MSRVNGESSGLYQTGNVPCNECCGQLVQNINNFFKDIQAFFAPPPAPIKQVTASVLPTSFVTKGVQVASQRTQTASASFLAPVRPIITTTKEMITYFDSCWNSKKEIYQGIGFDATRFNEKVAQHNGKFPLQYDPKEDYGYIEKRTVSKDSKIFVRADLHGDLKSLMENLKTLQKEGLLDAEYQCKSDVQLVFVGDFADRGRHSMQVIELLMYLRMENPNNITLIRGNHESVDINLCFGGNDKEFLKYLNEEKNWDVLESFYMRLPLTAYLGNKEYVQFTHGLFELYVDPSPLLNKSANFDTMPISKKRALSERVKRLDTPSAKRIQELWALDAKRKVGLDVTTYNWGDMGQETRLGNPANRKWKVSVEDVKHYLNVSGVEMIFRGHEHAMQHHLVDDKIVVTTLTVGMDTPYKYALPQPDCAYILTVGEKVEEWTKKALLRKARNSDTTITDTHPIHSIAI